MATPHLTSDNANATGAANADRLASIAMSESANTHLVVVTQATKWTNKLFLTTPAEAKWGACMATGIEDYPGRQGGTEVYADTLALVNAVGTCMNSMTWRNGYHPLVNAFTRGTMRGPYSHRSGISSSSARAEYIHSACAWRFNLHRLHFSRMSSFSAWLRIYVPSLTVQNNTQEPGLSPSGKYGNQTCVLFPANSGIGMWSGASELKCRLSTSLPALAADVAAGYDSWEIMGAANNGTTVGSDTYYEYHSVAYNPYHGDDCVCMPVWTANQRTPSGSSAPSAQPTLYYHDFQLTNSDNLDVLKANPSEVWVVAHFARTNGIAANAAGSHGLAPNLSACAWAYRADLLFQCSCASFNT